MAEVVASDRSAGQPYGKAARWVLPGNPPPDVVGREVLPLDADVQSRIVFSALPADIAKTVEWRLAEAGHVVCSNASAYRMHEDVPILLPETNAEHAALVLDTARKIRLGRGGLVTNSNCTSAPVVMSLAPLRRFGIEAVQVVSMQAISGGGYPGVPSLDIIDNVIPFINGEEPKVETEPRKMLGALAAIISRCWTASMSATCTRVPVLDGHLVAVSVRFADDRERRRPDPRRGQGSRAGPGARAAQRARPPVEYAPSRIAPSRAAIATPGTAWRRSSGGCARAR